MKKLMFLLALILSLSVCSAQTSDLDPGKKLTNVETAKGFTPIVDDSTDAVYVNFDLSEREDVYYYTLYTRLWATSKSAETTSPGIIVNSQYSIDERNYSNIDTATYYATVADTTIIFLENSTKVGYPYLRLKIAGVDSVSTQLNTAVGRFIK